MKSALCGTSSLVASAKAIITPPRGIIMSLPNITMQPPAGSVVPTIVHLRDGTTVTPSASGQITIVSSYVNDLLAARRPLRNPPAAYLGPHSGSHPAQGLGFVDQLSRGLCPEIGSEYRWMRVYHSI